MSASTAVGPHLLEALVLLGGGRLPLVRQQLHRVRSHRGGGTVGRSVRACWDTYDENGIPAVLCQASPPVSGGRGTGPAPIPNSRSKDDRVHLHIRDEAFRYLRQRHLQVPSGGSTVGAGARSDAQA